MGEPAKSVSYKHHDRGKRDKHAGCEETYVLRVLGSSDEPPVQEVRLLVTIQEQGWEEHRREARIKITSRSILSSAPSLQISSISRPWLPYPIPEWTPLKGKLKKQKKKTWEWTRLSIKYNTHLLLDIGIVSYIAKLFHLRGTYLLIFTEKKTKNR